MLYYISECILNSLKSEANDKTNLILSNLESLLNDCRHGKNSIISKYHTLNELGKLSYFSASAQSMLFKLADTFAERGTYISTVDCYVKLVVHEHESIVSDENGKTIYIRQLDKIDPDYFSTTKLIVENPTDSDFYKYITDFYMVTHLRSNTFCYNFAMVPGGGSTIGDILRRTISTNNCTCLCIVDSDRRYVDCKIGDTARHANKIYKKIKNHHVCKMLILKHREIENLLTYNILDSIEDIKNNNDIHSKIQNFHNSNLPYIDFKDGIRLKELIKILGRNKQMIIDYCQFHFNITIDDASIDLCINKDSCDCNTDKCMSIICYGYGDKILERAINSITNKQITPIFNTDICKAEWQDIGRLIYSWCISDQKSFS